jgi:DNA polymerase elongation subunit (family B)
MSYVSASMKRNEQGFVEGDDVYIWECIDHKHVMRKVPGLFEFYVVHEDGEYKSIFNEPLRKYEFDSYNEFRQARKMLTVERGLKLYESDISADTKVLSKLYYNAKTPELNVCMWDIEVDYATQSFGDDYSCKVRKKPKNPLGDDTPIDEISTTIGDIRALSHKQQQELEIFDDKTRRWIPYVYSKFEYNGPVGFSSPLNPYAPINAISMHKEWLKKSIVLAVPPPGFDLKNFDNSLAELTEIRFFKNEEELLLDFLNEIEDASILSGWNSSGFDDPYTCKRIEIVLGQEHLKRMSFPHANPPRYNNIFIKGKEQLQVELGGRVTLDYLELFKKFEFVDRQSYKLEVVSEELLPHLKKLSYPGTLEELYHNDFNHFLRYNVRDTEILAGFELKLNYIKTANEMVHSSTNQFTHIFGTVRMVDNAIINYCHYELDKRVPDRWDTKDGNIQGAYVLFPQRGLWKWICSIDINSLYPSAIRALNISPETIRGQFINNIKDWICISELKECDLTLRYEDGTYETKSTSEWIDFLLEKKWAITGYGTVYTQEFEGVIPSLLGTWYAQRKVFQRKKGESLTLAEQHKDDPVQYEYYMEQSRHYDRMQFIFKIKLNSTYGCLSNYNFRFFRLEAGESVTANGRMILRHQCREVNRLLDGEYNVDFPLYESTKVIDKLNKEHSKRALDALMDLENEEEEVVVKDNLSLLDLVNLEQKEYYHANTLSHDVALDGPIFNGEFQSKSVVYGDTDSSYFILDVDNVEEAVQYADAVADCVNKSYPAFMRKAFLCTPGYDEMIKCGREIVSDSGIFVEKKRYIVHVVDNEGKSVDKMKIMGLDLKKTTLPKPVATKLTGYIKRLLAGEEWLSIARDIVDYKAELSNFENLLEMGLPKGVNKVEEYTERYEIEGTKARLPGNAAAAIFYNINLKDYGDVDNMPISSGTKIKVYYLKNKIGKFSSIAIPTDMEILPQWFIENYIPRIDKDKQISRLVDNPLDNILKALSLKSPTSQEIHAHDLFEF